MDIVSGPDLTIESGQGVIQLRHHLTPAVGNTSEFARRVALEYLRALLRMADSIHLPIHDTDLAHLERTIDVQEEKLPAETRLFWLKDVPIVRHGAQETTIVLIGQTTCSEISKLTIPIEGAGIRIVCQHYPDDRKGVTSAYFTFHDIGLSAPANRIKFDPSFFEAGKAIPTLSRALGVTEDNLKNAAFKFTAFDPRNRRSQTKETTGEGPHGLTLGYKVEFNHKTPRGDPVACRAFYDLATDTLSQPYLLASACSGLNFSIDPVSSSGSTFFRPNSFTNDLDARREDCELHQLKTAADGRRQLEGPRVRIKEKNPLGYNPPKRRSRFAFHSRTNAFAAVSAYSHCDRMVRTLQEFELGDIFSGFLPIPVVHRSPLLISAAHYDGKAVAAFVHAVREEGTDRIKPAGIEMCFALADLSDHARNPLGIAADIRWVWHEFCHVLLAASTGELEFHFAHSAGDALAAIMSDVDLHLASDSLPDGWRGVTFPFVASPLRRHDRDVTRGWAWGGSLYDAPPHYPSVSDPAGYRGEQLISSTLFRLYRAVGGDAKRSDGTPDSVRRRAAARYVFYLLARAIKALGPAAVVPAKDARALAGAMMDADIHTGTFHDGPSRRLGGALHKVVRWAFQQQGLYFASSSSQHDAPGELEPVDVCIARRGGDPGDYLFTDDWQSKPSAVWIQHQAGGHTTDQVVLLHATNFIFIEVHNLGKTDAASVTVEVFTKSGAGHDIWDATPGVWTPLQLPGGNLTQMHPIQTKSSAQFGPFAWTPSAHGAHAIFVRASTAGDRSNADQRSRLSCAAGPIRMRDLVPFDNNLGYRAWHV